MADKDNQDIMLKDILDELIAQRNKKNSFWDRLGPLSTFISTVIIGGVGLFFTVSYNKQQAIQNKENQRNQSRVLEMQAVEKFIPYLTDTSEKKKEVALLVITTLGSAEFATQFAKLNPSKGTEAAADKIMAGASGSSSSEVPQSITTKADNNNTQKGAINPNKKSGWIYLGHYVAELRKWETRYFEFDKTINPDSLPSILKVRYETGAIYVRAGMPTPGGEFQKVQDVLKPPSVVKVSSVKEWSSTGFMWAEIEYNI